MGVKTGFRIFVKLVIVCIGILTGLTFLKVALNGEVHELSFQRIFDGFIYAILPASLILALILFVIDYTEKNDNF
ncbi:hypothetical protein JF50_09895 [Pseudoalteromonas luteoviolacea]|uniref:Uncharacterized protein n=1 Tax=Pseudoalteromonas luteoviolacea TaxID=43657 RepID=A0A0C1MS26_9GAMM|nr:hypothetical protein [Pseudoalteromonas luteoviolacea]KID57498.1 hypothetical protein JF50_09895 [Pseudoalteromonas luteoviolacea]